MDRVSLHTAKGDVEGLCDSRFSGVVDAFVENFEAREEVGASVALTLEGETVVDLWGGRTTEGGEPWKQDTIGVVFSCTKGASALCAHIAADRGLLDFDVPVTRYWPEFGQAGKEGAMVSMMLDHSVGLPSVRETLKDGAFYDYEYMVDRLAREAPFWKPGTRNGYHGVTSAWTVGEMVRRSTGKRMGVFLRDEVAGPLGVDFWMGLPEEFEPRVAPMINAPVDDQARNSRIAKGMAADPTGPTALFMTNMRRLQRQCARRSRRRDRLGDGGLQRPRPGRALRSARQRRGAERRAPRRRRHADPHGPGVGGHARRRHPGDSDALFARLHEVDGQPASGEQRGVLVRPLRRRVRTCRRRRIDRLRRPGMPDELRLHA